jgi:hypothetical protein
MLPPDVLCRWALVCQVFKDILPSYRIRLPTDKELATKVSKDVKKMREYERALLGAYQVGERGGLFLLLYTVKDTFDF